MLKLASADHGLVQVDVDGAALKAIQYANQLKMRLAGRLRTIDSPDDDALPALRSGGISVVRTGRAVRMSERFKDAAAKNWNLGTATPPDLWAEDVTRGYRVDVEDMGVWRSLCQRNVSYLVNRDPQVLPEPQADEGVVTAAATALRPSNCSSSNSSS